MESERKVGSYKMPKWDRKIVKQYDNNEFYNIDIINATPNSTNNLLLIAKKGSPTLRLFCISSLMLLMIEFCSSIFL